MTDLVEIKIPFSGSVENVEINDWLVAIGDVIEEGQVLADVSTDKADTELESPAAGKLVQILVEGGTEVKVGTAVALLVDPAASDEDVAAAIARYTQNAAE
jgi:pyruvate/2-oxoglutarate dehydrogenase complex dihydrolipoamide acyltransferase (E2) component